MSRSDESTPRHEPRFRPAGPGLTCARQCDDCGNRVSDTYGSSRPMRRGVRVFVCPSCTKKARAA